MPFPAACMHGSALASFCMVLRWHAAGSPQSALTSLMWNFSLWPLLFSSWSQSWPASPFEVAFWLTKVIVACCTLTVQKSIIANCQYRGEDNPPWIFVRSASFTRKIGNVANISHPLPQNRGNRVLLDWPSLKSDVDKFQSGHQKHCIKQMGSFQFQMTK